MSELPSTSRACQVKCCRGVPVLPRSLCLFDRCLCSYCVAPPLPRLDAGYTTEHPSSTPSSQLSRNATLSHSSNNTVVY